MGSKTLTRSKTTDILNKETGEYETIETEKEYRIKIDPDRFYMCFFEQMGSFYGIKHLSDMKLIVCMCELAEFNTGVVHMTKKTREYIVQITGISLSNISRNLKRLSAIKLVSEEKGDYTINANVFWKGDSKMRRELLKENSIDLTVKIPNALQPNTNF